MWPSHSPCQSNIGSKRLEEASCHILLIIPSNSSSLLMLAGWQYRPDQEKEYALEYNKGACSLSELKSDSLLDNFPHHDKHKCKAPLSYIFMLTPNWVIPCNFNGICTADTTSLKILSANCFGSLLCMVMSKSSLEKPHIKWGIVTLYFQTKCLQAGVNTWLQQGKLSGKAEYHCLWSWRAKLRLTC